MKVANAPYTIKELMEKVPNLSLNAAKGRLYRYRHGLVPIDTDLLAPVQTRYAKPRKIKRKVEDCEAWGGTDEWRALSDAPRGAEILNKPHYGTWEAKEYAKRRARKQTNTQEETV